MERGMPQALMPTILHRKTFSLPVKVYFEDDGTEYSEMNRIKEFLVRFGNREKSTAQLDLINNFSFVFEFTPPPSDIIRDIVLLEVNKGCSDAAARDVTDSSYGLIFFCDDLNEAKLKAILKKIRDFEITYRQKYSQLIVTRSLADNFVLPANSSTEIYVLENPAYDERDNPFITFVRRMISQQEELMETTTKETAKDADCQMHDIPASFFRGRRRGK